MNRLDRRCRLYRLGDVSSLDRDVRVGRSRPMRPTRRSEGVSDGLCIQEHDIAPKLPPEKDGLVRVSDSNSKRSDMLAGLKRGLVEMIPIHERVVVDRQQQLCDTDHSLLRTLGC